MLPLKKVRIDPTLTAIGAIAGRMGIKAYLVGGAVRDLLSGRKDFDRDVMVEGNSEKLVKAFAKRTKSRVVSYPRFGTFTLSAPRMARIDFATARKETYRKPGALPEVVFSDFENDIFRRDFTINALAVRLDGKKTGEIIDLCGGKRDLKNGILRILHRKSFRDDPTRIFRLARFASRGFKIDKLTARLAAAASGFIRRVSAERVVSELLLLMEEEDPYSGLLVLQRLGIAGHALPGVDISPRLAGISKVKGTEKRLSMLFAATKKNKRKKLYSSLRFPNKLKNTLEARLLPPKRKTALDGHDLIKMGYSQGPRFKKILESLAASGIVSRKRAKKYVFDNFPQKI